jgi:hypothetical protein
LEVENTCEAFLPAVLGTSSQSFYHDYSKNRCSLSSFSCKTVSDELVPSIWNLSAEFGVLIESGEYSHHGLEMTTQNLQLTS